MVSSKHTLAQEYPASDKQPCSCASLPLSQQMFCPAFRDMEVEDAIELGRRSIYHATFRDAVSGGTVSGRSPTLAHFPNILI